ncbi:Polynucleotidyl transferase ribonuclease h-like superfamily protein, partial [Thalictrum thalictroides]
VQSSEMEDDDVTIQEFNTDYDDKEMYTIDFYGHNFITTVTASPAVVRNWIQSTCRCLIFQLTRTDSVPNILRRFLDDPNTTFVGIWNHSDADRLLKSEHELSLSSDPKDLRYSIADRFDDPDLERASMETLVSRFFGYDGLKKDSDVAKSDWNVECLTDKQVLYAAVDAYVSFQMGKVMF